ncbi:hypothetical protein A8950_1985 [Dongia mobilis]|uniref:NYN domain-containing protein n=1 Tax=Dongia mobilis TaxID=578943 RepID=A0A4R6WMQ1_9PROT|nr:hypothetical protein A8950_1985 [Dongia mobilis]
MIPVTVFVDWTAQFHNAGTNRIEDAKTRSKLTLRKTADAIADVLSKVDKKSRYRVKLRFYHGWHAGLSPTANRLVLQFLDSEYDLSPSTYPNVRFEHPFSYGDRLLAALPHRLRQKNPIIHLPDTLRSSLDDSGRPREKMVDTALACDLLVHARMEADEWRIVFAEDDDLVPALFVAEAWSKSSGGKTFLVRKRPGSKHLALDGLVKEYLA